MSPLQLGLTSPGRGILTKRAISEIFSNLAEIIPVNQELLKRIKDRIENQPSNNISDVNLGDIFLDLVSKT